jgi:RNA polymerase sigma factor (sigma-70 family)
MSDPALTQSQLQEWLRRLQGGDRAAEDELLRCVRGRLERLTRKMLNRRPGLRRWVEADDVLQNALLRMVRNLRQLRPDSVRDFFGVAAEQIRRELIDLTLHYFGARGCGVHETGDPRADDPSKTGLERAATGDDSDDLEKWCAFHEAVESLPTAEREVVGLVFYHGWTQARVAELFGVTERTVRRQWHAALIALRRKRKGEIPSV